jgi:hypothetical protein
MSEVEVVKSAKEEILEAVAALKEIAKCGKQVLADGKVNLLDVPALVALVGKQEVLLEGAKGLDDVKVKEISLDEAVEIALAVVAAVKEVKS